MLGRRKSLFTTLRQGSKLKEVKGKMGEMRVERMQLLSLFPPAERGEGKVIFGSAEVMHELDDESIHLVVTSPPYFNAPFDYPDFFPSYDAYLQMMERVAKEIFRVLARGRVACVVCDDVLVKGVRYPIVADLTRLFMEVGFSYRDRITWLKPEGYIRISRRSGVLLQHPYPLYAYFDNVQESIIIFAKGKFDYKSVSPETREASRIDVERFLREKWYLNVWQITNVLPNPRRLEKGVAAFPEALAFRLITLFSHKGEVVLDPFLGSGTTLKVAAALGRRGVGYEINTNLLPIIKEKLRGLSLDIIIRSDAISIPLPSGGR